MSAFGNCVFGTATFSPGTQFGYAKFGHATFQSAIIFMGDSITVNYPTRTYWTNTIKAGVPGERSDQMAARFSVDVVAKKPAQVHILAGTNDTLQGFDSVSSVEAMACAAQAAGIEVILATIPPQPTAGHVLIFNAALSAMAALRGFPVADYYSALLNGSGVQDASLFLDGVHPNLKGYKKMRAVLEPLI